MTHCITGFIAKADLLNTYATQNTLHAPIALTQGIAFLPLQDEHIDALIQAPQTNIFENFNYLSEQLIQTLQKASQLGVIAYIETDYFGGMGGQGAVVFSHGELIYGPEMSMEIGPINTALKHLGVKHVPSAYDKFDTVGLGNYRTTEEWLECKN